MPTYLLDASALCKRYFVNEIGAGEPILQALQAMKVIKKRPGPVESLVVACALDFEPVDRVLVSSDVDLNALAQQFGITTFDPEHPAP